MPFPGVRVEVGNSNLLANISVPDAVPAIVAIGEKAGEYRLYGAADFPSGGVEAGRGAVEEFYAEVGGSVSLLYVEHAGSVTEAVRALCNNHPEVNLVAVVDDVKAQTYNNTGALCDNVVGYVSQLYPILVSNQAMGRPVRVLLGGCLDGSKVESGIINYDAKGASNGYVAIVLGSSYESGVPAVGVALGRATKVAAHVKIGDGTLGPLSMREVYYGDAEHPYDKVSDYIKEAWHDKGYMTFMRRQGLEGYYFGVDNMCSSDDYSTLVHGRVIDKAQRIAIAAYMPYVETPMQVADDGTIDVADAESMAKIIESQLRARMGDQVSNVKVVVPVEQDLINTKTLTVQVSVLPLGYNTWISVELNLASRLD